MNVGLLDIDSHNFPNLALMKLSAYHKSHGDTVTWANGFEHYDVLYMSKIFTETPDDYTIYNADIVIKGGTGYDSQVKLLYEVEHTYPDYSLYPQYPAAYGFLTRGCPRSCPFCLVTQKEGNQSIQVAELPEFWRGQREIKLLDANLLFCSDREKILQSLIDSGAWIDFTQGLDIRLTDIFIARMLKNMKLTRLHFAWDNPNQELTVEFDTVKKVTGLDCWKLIAYVLTNFNSTHEQDLYRIYKLREIGYDPYVMVYDKSNAPRQTRLLQRWVNNRKIWRKCEKFEDYDPSLR